MTLVALAFIAFLRAGDVWVQPAGGGAATNVTRTGGRVEDFRYSAQGDYLAYAKRIRRSEERPVTSIVVMRVDSRRVLAELRPQEGWIDIDRWLGSRLIYHSSAAMEVSGFFEYDALTQKRRELDLDAGSIALDSDASPDGALVAWVDNAGVGPTFESRLHLEDSRKGDTIVARRRSAMSPSISPDRRRVAFLEVVDAARDPSNARDRVWVTQPGGDAVLVHDGPVQAKGGGSALTWSTDGARLAMNFGSRIVVLDPDRETPGQLLRGTDACWIDATHLVAGVAAGIDLFDAASGASQLVAAGGSRPQCLSAGDAR